MNLQITPSKHCSWHHLWSLCVNPKPSRSESLSSGAHLSLTAPTLISTWSLSWSLSLSWWTHALIAAFPASLCEGFQAEKSRTIKPDKSYVPHIVNGRPLQFGERALCFVSAWQHLDCAVLQLLYCGKLFVAVSRYEHLNLYLAVLVTSKFKRFVSAVEVWFVVTDGSTSIDKEFKLEHATCTSTMSRVG